jgi:hypothetical protein
MHLVAVARKKAVLLITELTTRCRCQAHRVPVRSLTGGDRFGSCITQLSDGQ